jgi:hypothetical protein
MDKKEILIREIAQRLRDIADTIDQNQSSNLSSLQHLTILIYSFMYCCNFYLNCK